MVDDILSSWQASQHHLDSHSLQYSCRRDGTTTPAHDQRRHWNIEPQLSRFHSRTGLWPAQSFLPDPIGDEIWVSVRRSPRSLLRRPSLALQRPSLWMRISLRRRSKNEPPGNSAHPHSLILPREVALSASYHAGVSSAFQDIIPIECERFAGRHRQFRSLRIHCRTGVAEQFPYLRFHKAVTNMDLVAATSPADDASPRAARRACKPVAAPAYGPCPGRQLRRNRDERAPMNNLDPELDYRARASSSGSASR